MAANLYGKFLVHALKGDVDFDTLNLKAMICAAGYTPDFDAHEFRSSVTNEVSGTGYTAGGVSLTGESVTIDGATNRVKIDANDAAWTTVTFTAGTQLIVYVDTGNAATDILVSRHTFPSAQSPSAQDFTFVFHADGIAYGTY